MSRRMSSKREGSGGRGPRTIRRGILLGCFLAAGSMILAKAAHLQVVEHERWASEAEDQHRERLELPPRRGAIYDRNGVPLALSHEMYQVSVAPGELRDPAAAARSLREGLDLTASRANAAVDPSRAWVVLPGRYTAEQHQKVGTLRGVYFDRQFERFYPQGDAGREIIGAVTRDGRALGGIEQQLDELLSGTPGYSVLRREAGGEAQAAISLPVVPPTDGASVHLTIDFDVQEIADEALSEAMRKTRASGGDLMIGDPRTGEILAAISRRTGRSRSLTAITEPYEPGSTLKPFLAATLLTEGLAELTDSVFAEEGIWQDGSRTFRDTSPHEWLSLASALEVSSNIASVKFAKRLSPGQQYSYLRDFGLGTATGIEYPSESTGWLRKPAEWSGLSSASLAMGYELSVTPLQMLGAYAALANGGVLMQPYLVREIRGPDGRAIERRTPSAVRRVIPEQVARAVTEVLASVVEDGTASRASLSTFSVAGKTGTSRRTSAGGGYAPGAYTSTFVGFFPAQDPQIVIFVKLDEPQGEYYGGLTAAPVTRETLQGILAARTGTIDGRTLLATRAGSPPPRPVSVDPPSEPDLIGGGTYVFSLDEDVREDPLAEVAEKVEVPGLAGLSVRVAVRKAHGAGLSVRVTGTGEVQRTVPPAGTVAERGAVITLIAAAP
jgi:cell division protein FtsI (penicillin-binding protein 3)